MAAADHVPEELIEDIFSRVPVKSLIRFKTVSKKWYSLLSQDYNFAKFHLKRPKNQRLVFFKSHRENLFQSLNMDTMASCEFKNPVQKVELVGSANGLVCVAPYRERCCYVWNPCTGEFKKISVPIKHLQCGEGVWERVLGFGYDSCSNDYKIVANNSYEHFQIFSLKTNSWKIIESAYLMRDQAFHLNGALHWCLNDKIAALDLAKEVFSYIELPDEMKLSNIAGWWHCVTLTILEYRGCLCVAWKRDIWIMKKYGDSKSWVKLSTSLAGCDRKPLGMSTLGEVLYGTRSGFVKSDIHGKMSDDDESQLNFSALRSGYSYMESLISPKCFAARTHGPKR